jgi:hypothetical protein
VCLGERYTASATGGSGQRLGGGKERRWAQDFIDDWHEREEIEIVPPDEERG